MLNGSIYLFFSILLSIGCSTSPKKNASAAKTEKGSNVAVPKIENAAKPAVYIISISQMKFNPEEIKVHKGDTVIWKNEDLVPHCVTELNNKAWTSLVIPPGGSWKMAVLQSSDYYCAIHQVMKGKIVVE